MVVMPVAWAAVDLSPEAPAAKERSCFYPAAMVAQGRANVGRFDWGRQAREAVVKAAAPWRAMSDEQLWGLMFGPAITRSWMVWSNGFCPACHKPVPMYTWRMDALGLPWKVRCPHCAEVFPKNDFAAYYRSGLDDRGVFDPARADRPLLFNAEHPDATDPLRGFGVDDGEGYVEGESRWRFIGAYLIYGQWKQAVLGGLRNLAAAYLVTGDQVYAHKAGVLLDRVADLYPSFDFIAQAVVYERRLGSNGYVSVWHDACEETRELALCYDAVYEGLRGDEELARFSAAQATRYKVPRPKASLADVIAGIEDGILRDPLRNQHKIHSNYPRTPICVATLMSVLNWYRSDAFAVLDEAVAKATAVDGVTGEKGLSGYSSFTIQALAVLFGYYGRAMPGFTDDLLRRYPQIHDTYRFHIDTWCLGSYYPRSGDCSAFAQRTPSYVGVSFDRGSPGDPGGVAYWVLQPSMARFMWDLYRATGDADLLKVTWPVYGGKAESLAADLFCADPEAFGRDFAAAVEKAGPALEQRSVNKRGWCLAVLRSGRGAAERDLWLDYDAGGGHGHADALALGLFAHGLDLLPDFGYPPVQYGGWDSPRALWYTLTAAHNTVLVDRANQEAGGGGTRLWGDGDAVRLIQAAAPAVYGISQYSRLAALVDVSDTAFYVADVFRVVGGSEHIRFLMSGLGALETTGLSPAPADDFGHGAITRSTRLDPAARPGWTADWSLENRFGYLPENRRVRMRYTDLTSGGAAGTSEAWVSLGLYNENDEAWAPRLEVRRSGPAPLASCFVGLLEPYEGRRSVAAARRLPLEARRGVPYGDGAVAVEVRLADGRRDLIVSADAENPLGATPDWREARNCRQEDWQLSTDAELCFVRLDAAGRVERVALAAGRRLRVGNWVVELKGPADFLEVIFGPMPILMAGDASLVEYIRPVVGLD
jgi:hypothetical protein